MEAWEKPLKDLCFGSALTTTAPSTLTTFIPLTLWTCRLQSPTLINHWGWPSTLLGSAQPAQASSLIACASGGWSVSYAPALALGVGPAWHGCSHFTSQPCQPCFLLLGLHVFVCVYSLAIYCWPASHKWTSSLVYVYFLSLCCETQNILNTIHIFTVNSCFYYWACQS